MSADQYEPPVSAPKAGAGVKDWMLTHSRRQVWPLALKHQDVNLKDIAASLSKQCRYNGHVDRFYSVAEHSVRISYALQQKGHDTMTALIGLHHDDSECWLGDQIKPLKNAMEQKGFSFKPFELEIEQKVSERFGLTWPWPEVIHEFDRKIVRDEKEQLKQGGPEWDAFGIPAEGLGITLECWDWQKAERMFIARHHELSDLLA